MCAFVQGLEVVKIYLINKNPWKTVLDTQEEMHVAKM